MKVINPTNESIAILYKGVDYVCEANDSAVVPDEVAIYWKTMIHNFVQLESESIVTSKVEEKEVEQAELVQEEKPVKKVVKAKK